MNFDWLIELPESTWHAFEHGGWYAYLSRDWFLDRSSVTIASGDWRTQFDAWGQQQNPQLALFPSSVDDAVFIVRGPRPPITKQVDE